MYCAQSLQKSNLKLLSLIVTFLHYVKYGNLNLSDAVTDFNEENLLWGFGNWQHHPKVLKLRDNNQPKEESKPSKGYNSDCPKCGAQAYTGLWNVECSKNCS
jgi:hypothetical protein